MPNDPKETGAVWPTAVTLAACVGLGAYAAFGPAGLLPRAAMPELPAPTRTVDAEGSARAAVDAERWRAACEAAGLSPLAAPNGVELAPVERLVAHARAWTSGGDGDALGRMGEVQLALGLNEAARDLFVAARALGRERAHWTYFVGVAEQLLGDHDAALEALRDAASLEPSYGVTHARIGTLLLEQGRLDEADAAFTTAAALPPAEAQALLGRARVALRRGDAAGALGLSDRALALASRDYQAHRVRAQALAALGRHADAEAAAELAAALPSYTGWVSLDPRLAAVHERSGTAQSLEFRFGVALQLKDLARAVSIGEELLRAVPRSMQVQRTLATVHANHGNLPRALELAKGALALAPTNLETLSTALEIAVAANDGATITDVAPRLLDLDRSRADSWALVGRAHFVQKRASDALAAVERAESLAPTEERFPLLRAEMLRQLGRLEEARFTLSSALARRPSFAEVARQLAALGG